MWQKNYKIILILIIILFILLFPFIAQKMQSYFSIRVAGLIGIYIILALGLNIVIGFTGLLDLGYIAFYGIGAYTAAILSINGVSFWLSLPVAVLVSVFIRFLLGISVLRLRGDYLAIVTLGFGEITRIVLNNWDKLTNGPKGLPRVGEQLVLPNFFGIVLRDNIHYYYLILVVVILAIIINRRLDNSRVGRAWVAIREDEIAAEVMGINVTKIKLLAFSLSAIFAAIAGVIFVHWNGFVSPESFNFMESILLVAVVVLGGMGSIPGVILGAVLLVGVPELLRLLGSEFVLYRVLIFSLALIFMVIFRPEGIIPSKRRMLELHPESDRIKMEEDQTFSDLNE